MVSSLIEPFIERHEDWKMVELSSLEVKFRVMNTGYKPAQTLYLYENPAYSTVYSIMELYKNYPGWLKTLIHN